MQKLDGVFDGDEVIGARGVDAIDHRGEGGGLTGTGGASDENESALLLANLVDHVGKVQFFGSANLGWNHAENHAHVATLLENVNAETPETRDAVSHVQLSAFLELLLLPVGHHAKGHGEHFFGRDAGNVGDSGERAV